MKTLTATVLHASSQCFCFAKLPTASAISDFSVKLLQTNDKKLSSKNTVNVP